MCQVLKNKQYIFFVSDVHLGVPNDQESFEREQLFVKWLEEIYPVCSKLFLLGDIFDFWFDYDKVIPKGFVRVLAAIAKFTDNGKEVHYFKGNHDMWLNGYFAKELNLIIHSNTYTFKENNVSFFVGHGDGKGPKDYKYKILKKIFRNPLSQWFFKWLHPDIGIRLANIWSKKSRVSESNTENTYLDKENEWLYLYSKKKNEEKPYNYFIFGHRHIPLTIKIDEKAEYINLGDWIQHKSYAVFDGKNTTLQYYKP